jgi:hypothetical protein
MILGIQYFRRRKECLTAAEILTASYLAMPEIFLQAIT